jgi:phage-related protein
MDRWQVSLYTTAEGHCPVEEFVAGLPVRVQARFAHVVELLETYGLQVGEPFVKSIRGVRKLAEIRVRVAAGRYRVLFLTYTGRKFVLLHGFVKKSQATPPQEIRTAVHRMRDYLHRSGGDE